METVRFLSASRYSLPSAVSACVFRLPLALTRISFTASITRTASGSVSVFRICTRMGDSYAS